MVGGDEPVFDARPAHPWRSSARPSPIWAQAAPARRRRPPIKSCVPASSRPSAKPWRSRTRKGCRSNKLIERLGKGAGSSWYFVNRAPFMAQQSFSGGISRAAARQGSAHLPRHGGTSTARELPVVESTLAQYAQLIVQGFGDEDISSIYRLKSALFPAQTRVRRERADQRRCASPPARVSWRCGRPSMSRRCCGRRIRASRSSSCRMLTQGDRIQDRSLAAIGGKGLFIKELEVALEETARRHRRAFDEGCARRSSRRPRHRRGARRARMPAMRWSLPKAARLDDLPRGARVGTSSLRRQAQLLAARPDLRIEALRGNVDTRLRRLDAGEMDAIVLACAGLIRLGLESRITARLDPKVCLPAVAQGVIGIECRGADAADSAICCRRARASGRPASPWMRSVPSRTGSAAAVSRRSPPTPGSRRSG